MGKGDLIDYRLEDIRALSDVDLVIALKGVQDEYLINDLIRELVFRIRPVVKKSFARLDGLGVEYAEFEQIVVIRIFKGLKDLNEPEKFWHFLKVVALHAAFTELKTRLKIKNHHDPLHRAGNDDEDTNSQLSDYASHFEDQADKKIMLDQIMSKYRGRFTATEYAVLNLYRKDKSVKDIAKILRKSVGYVRNIISDLPDKIRALLKE